MCSRAGLASNPGRHRCPTAYQHFITQGRGGAGGGGAGGETGGRRRNLILDYVITFWKGQWYVHCQDLNILAHTEAEMMMMSDIGRLQRCCQMIVSGSELILVENSIKLSHTLPDTTNHCTLFTLHYTLSHTSALKTRWGYCTMYKYLHWAGSPFHRAKACLTPAIDSGRLECKLWHITLWSTHHITHHTTHYATQHTSHITLHTECYSMYIKTHILAHTAFHIEDT